MKDTIFSFAFRLLSHPLLQRGILNKIFGSALAASELMVPRVLLRNGLKNEADTRFQVRLEALEQRRPLALVALNEAGDVGFVKGEAVEQALAVKWRQRVEF